ncbi:MAG: hypothetical protein KDD64_11575 [Bdellovibrionales bacterium]|nr:hypothetical protein [Bdellovibrionales bacterium]
MSLLRNSLSALLVTFSLFPLTRAFAENFLVFDQSSVPLVVSFPSQDPPQSVELELGDWGEQFFLQIDSFLPWKEYTIEVRYFQHLSLQGEGPHLDFIDLPGKTSSWITLQRVNAYSWRSPNMEAIHFYEESPPSSVHLRETVSELLRGASQAERDWWLSRVSSCAPPFDSGCSYGLSRAEFRVTRWTQDGVTSRLLGVFEIPLGC